MMRWIRGGFIYREGKHPFNCAIAFNGGLFAYLYLFGRRLTWRSKHFNLEFR